MRTLVSLLLCLSCLPVLAQTALGTFPTSKAVYASPALLNDGAIVFGCNDAAVYCVTHSGSAFTQRWKTTLPDIIDSTAAVAHDGTIYVGCFDAKLYALNSSTGAIKWSYTTGGFISGSPALAADGTVYVCSGDGNLYAVNPDGTLKWTHNADTPVDPYPSTDLILEGTPVVGSDGTVYYGTNDGRLFAVSAAGSTLWSFSTYGGTTAGGEASARIKSAPALSANGNIHFVNGLGYLVTLLPTGILYWEAALVDSTQNSDIADSSPIIDANGNIFTANRLGTVFAYNSSGTQLWSKSLGDIYYSSGCLDSNGRLYYAYYDGANSPNTSKLICIQALTGTSLWTSATINGIIDSSPVLSSEGKLYFGVWGTSSLGASLSNLSAYQAAPVLTSVATLGATSWPCFGRSHMRSQRYSASVPPTFSGSSSALLRGGSQGTANLALSTTGWHGYQWSKGSVNYLTGAVSGYTQITGQTASALRISNPLRANAGIYQCLVSNDAGQRYSPKTYVAVLESFVPNSSGFTAVTYQPVILSALESQLYQFAPDFKTWTNSGLVSTNLGTDTTTATTKASHSLSGNTSPQFGFRWKVSAP